MSAFIGTQLTTMLDALINSDAPVTLQTENGNDLLEHLPKIPEILIDNTDRNRTSPFAFTGNKFEFRAVGSAQTCAAPMITLNLIVADQLRNFKVEVDQIIAQNIPVNEALITVVKKYIHESKDIRFEGNNYSEEWAIEAARRGLSNLRTTPEALKSMADNKAIDLFVRNKVLTARELHARHEIHLENYIKKIQIESRVLGDLAGNHIIPVAIRYQNTLIENVKGLKEVLDMHTYGKLSRNQLEIITEISEHIDRIKSFGNDMVEARKVANRIEIPEEKAFAYCDTVLPFFEKIRYHVDRLEMLIDDELWPLPKYRELLFTR
jgi:glutamine synthetase